MTRQVYTFGGGVHHEDPRARDKTIVGGKGANLAVMSEIGLPVPPGFTIVTEQCVAFLASGADFRMTCAPKWPRASPMSKLRWARSSAIRPIRCCSPSVPARGFPCPA